MGIKVFYKTSISIDENHGKSLIFSTAAIVTRNFDPSQCFFFSEFKTLKEDFVASGNTMWNASPNWEILTSLQNRWTAEGCECSPSSGWVSAPGCLDPLSPLAQGRAVLPFVHPAGVGSQREPREWSEGRGGCGVQGSWGQAWKVLCWRAGTPHKLKVLMYNLGDSLDWKGVKYGERWELEFYLRSKMDVFGKY